MFLHPTLRNINLSCLDFLGDLDKKDRIVEEKAKSTPLQSLTLIECNIDVRFLDTVLSLPKALKELSIGERLHAFPGCEPSMDWTTRTSSALFLTALQRQAESLERLYHVGGALQYLSPRQTDPEGAARLRSMTRLENLELGFESHLYYYLRQNGFPPELKVLKLLDSAISLNAGHDIRTMSDVAFRSITTLVTDHMHLEAMNPEFTIQLQFSDQSIFRLFVIAHPAEQNRLLSTLFLDRPAIYKIAQTLKSYNANFIVSRENFPSGTPYIPPYMYGEEIPIEEVMYHSSDYWRFNGIDYQYTDDESLREQMKASKSGPCDSCKRRDLPAIACRILSGKKSCLPCAQHNFICRWTEEPAEAPEAAEEEQDVIEEFEDYIAG